MILRTIFIHFFLFFYFSDQVSSHKRLRGGVFFIDVIPKTATGKIMRRELKKIQSKL